MVEGDGGKVSSGSAVLDGLLGGGYESDVVTTIYGPAGSGKTTACLMASVSVATRGKKVIFIDTEGGFSGARLGQLCREPGKVLPNILFLKPTNFEEQKKCIERLKSMISQKIGLVVVDTITNLYRVERAGENSELNRELSRQIAFLVEVARQKSMPVLLTNQVYSDFEDRKSVRMVGGDIITYNSKCLIELKPLHGSKRAALLQKHRHLPQSDALFEIVADGFAEVKDKGFRLF